MSDDERKDATAALFMLLGCMGTAALIGAVIVLLATDWGF